MVGTSHGRQPCAWRPSGRTAKTLSLSLNSQADPHPAALRSGGSCTLSPCRPGAPTRPSAPASPWARGERWVRAHGAAGTAASGAKDGLAIDVLVSVSGSLSLSLLASSNSPHSTCLTSSHPWAPPRSHLLLAALPDYSLPPLGSALPGPPQVSVNTRVPSSVEAPNCGLPPASRGRRQVVLEPGTLTHLIRSCLEDRREQEGPGHVGTGCPGGLGQEEQGEVGGSPLQILHLFKILHGPGKRT